MPYSDELPEENENPWYIPIVNAWNNLKTFINNLEARLFDSGFNVKSYGAVGNGSTDDSAAINAAIAAAAAVSGSAVGGRVVFPRGAYRAENIIVSPYVTLRGLGGFFSRFGPNNSQGNTSVRILRGNSTSNLPVVTLQGAGSGIENMQLEGSGAPGTILVQQGFETTVQNVRVIAGGGMGIDIQKANNTRWLNVFVDNCGSVTLPAVNIWSKTGTGGANETNTLDVDGLTIERSVNRALDVAVGATVDQWWAEWVRIVRLHIESNSQNAGAGNGVGNTDPLIRLGNIRQFDLIDPFIYGGPGYLIQHDQQAVRGYGNGGIRLIGGSILGSDTTTGVAATPNLIHLINGDDFAAIGTRFMRHTGAAIVVDSTYGQNVFIGPSSTYEPTASILSDARTVPTPLRMRGDLNVRNRILASGPQGSLGGAAGIGTTPPTPTRQGSEVAGAINWGTGTGPAAGAQINYVFPRPYATAPRVVLTPNNAATAGLVLYVGSSTLGFTVYAVNAPAAGQAVGTYSVNFVVVGTDAL